MDLANYWWSLAGEDLRLQPAQQACFFAAQISFVCLKDAPNQTLCSLLTSEVLDITNMLKPAVLSPVPQLLTKGNGKGHLIILFSLGSS